MEEGNYITVELEEERYTTFQDDTPIPPRETNTHEKEPLSATVRGFVFQKLETRDLIQCRAVCKDWKDTLELLLESDVQRLWETSIRFWIEGILFTSQIMKELLEALMLEAKKAKAEMRGERRPGAYSNSNKDLRLAVSNIAPGATQSDLEQFFKKCGRFELQDPVPSSRNTSQVSEISFFTQEGFDLGMDMDEKVFMGYPLQIGPPSEPLSGADTRLVYLHDCVSLIQASINKAKPKVSRMPEVHCFRQLLKLLKKELDQALRLLKENVDEGKSLNSNFDIFEFALMRYICQLNAMFLEADETVLRTPSIVIQDPLGREAWDRIVGKDIYATDASFLDQVAIGLHRIKREKIWFELGFEDPKEADLEAEARATFNREKPLVSYLNKSKGRFEDLPENEKEERIEKERIKKTQEDFHASQEFRFFEYCINFPRDNVITAYKWHCVCSQFGPLSELKKSFKKFSSGGGFLGVVNSIQAAEILQNYPIGTTLIRFSRLQPDVIAEEAEAASFRFQSVNSVTKEQLGVSEWRFIDLNLDLSALHQATSSTQYYKRKKPYYRNVADN